MPAVVLTPDREIALEERPRPTLRPDRVIVEVDLCGICGSDLHAAQLPQVYHRDCILGHESTGHIVAVGADVADWSIGQRVAVNPNGNVCGVCGFCRSGRLNFCRQATLETALGLQADGALAPLMAAFPSHLRAIPPALAPRGAAWVEPATTALRAVELATPGGVIVVVGSGRGSGLDPATILLKEITVRGSYTYIDEFDRAIDLIATGQLIVDDLTGIVTPLADTLTAFDALRAGRIMKALIAPGQL
jgi:threonine dehydrogenase-like Zn-dependent dehydrogenase